MIGIDADEIEKIVESCDRSFSCFEQEIFTPEVAEKIVGYVHEKMKAHCMCVTPDWYHDGLESDSAGRLCRRCHKRQNIPYRDLVHQVSWSVPSEIPDDVNAVLDCNGDSWRRYMHEPGAESRPPVWERLDKEVNLWHYRAGMYRSAPFVAGGEGA